LSALLFAFQLLSPVSAIAETTKDKAAVLSANAEFYRAFRESDIVAMDTLWGRIGKIAVEHPNGMRLEGRTEVMASWAAILLRPLVIHCVVEAVRMTGERAIVICLEQLNPGKVRMQNIFHRETGAWKLIYHGPISETLS